MGKWYYGTLAEIMPLGSQWHWETRHSNMNMSVLRVLVHWLIFLKQTPHLFPRLNFIRLRLIWYAFIKQDHCPMLDTEKLLWTLVKKVLHSTQKRWQIPPQKNQRLVKLIIFWAMEYNTFSTSGGAFANKLGFGVRRGNKWSCERTSFTDLRAPCGFGEIDGRARRVDRGMQSFTAASTWPHYTAECAELRLESSCGSQLVRTWSSKQTRVS